MFKTLFFSVASVFILAFPKTLPAYDARCMVDGQKFKDCDVTANGGVLAVRFSSPKDQSLDRTIPGDKIKRITDGELARKDTMKSFVMGPLLFFSFFDGDNNKGAYGIEYVDANGKKDSFFFQLKNKKDFSFGTSLKKMGGKN